MHDSYQVWYAREQECLGVLPSLGGSQCAEKTKCTELYDTGYLCRELFYLLNSCWKYCLETWTEKRLEEAWQDS